MKSSPILGHPPNSFLTRGRGFQSSPIGRVNRGVGNAGLHDSPLSLFVTQRQLMRLFAVKLILSYEQKCKVRSKFLKN